MSLQKWLEHVTPIGITDFRNTNLPFGIKAKDRLQHIYVIGKTGVGKSTLLQNMAIVDIEQGNGLAVIDPHGDVAENLLDYIPASRINDVIYFNATDTEYPIGFNPLYNVPPNKRHLVASILISTFKHIWLSSWGPRLEYILRNCLLTLLECDNAATLLDIQPLLVDKDFRELLLYRIANKQLLSFWHDEFDKYPVALRSEAIAPILNKVGVFSSNETLRNIVGQEVSTINIKSVLDEKKILICNLSKGILGEDVSSLLGSMLVSAIHFAALERAERPIEERQPFYLYIDEMHSFISFSFINILSEARKYGLALFLTHQYLEQISEEIRTAIFGNVGSIISFRVGAEDAAYLEKEFYPTFTQTDFINLPPYSIYIKLMIDGVSSKPFSAKTLMQKQSSQSYKTSIIRSCHARFSKKLTIEDETSTGVNRVQQTTLFTP